MEKNEITEERTTIKYRRRIGTVTFGVLLIVVGICSLVSIFAGVNFLRFVITAWPVALIMLGGECIYYSSKENIEIKYDIWGIILSGGILLVSFCVAVACFVLNDIVFRNDNFNKVLDKVSYEITQEILDVNEDGNTMVEIDSDEVEENETME